MMLQDDGHMDGETKYWLYRGQEKTSALMVNEPKESHCYGNSRCAENVMAKR